MSESTASPFQNESPLHGAIGVLDKVDRELADLQAEEAMVWRFGTVALLACGLVSGVAALVGLGLLIRRFSGARASR